MYGLSSDFDLSEASAYTNPSFSTNHSKIHTTTSFGATARGVAGAFITCFVPQCSRSGRAAPQKDTIVQANDFSIATRKRGDGLEIAERLDIAVDVAHAIAYHPIIHRDIKASNILLTESLRAKVADFGFARLAAEDPEATHVSTQIKGTAGYMDPEYIRTYQLTDKSDVYSFGVLLVELVTGRHPIEHHRHRRDRITTQWAMQRYMAGDAVMAMDARLRRSPASVMAVERVMGLAAECLEEKRRSRPSMNKCAEVLWGIRRDLLLPLSTSTRPANSSLDELDNNCSIVTESSSP